jgi:lipocalin
MRIHFLLLTGDSWVYVVDTDDKSWALVVRCFPNNGMNWAIFSKEKMMDPKLVKSLLKEVEEMGFKLFHVVEVPYEKCMSRP